MKCKNISGPRWLGDPKRAKHFSDLHLKLSYFQAYLPLLREVETVPRYTELLEGTLSEEIDLILRHNLPTKLRDPGSFDINITLGNDVKVRATLDLGASINLMPYAMYILLGLGELNQQK